MGDTFLKLLSNEELLTKFLFARDTLVQVRMELFKQKDKDMQEIFELTSKEFNDLKNEIYRRMSR